MMELSESGMIRGHEVGDEEMDSLLAGQVAKAEEFLQSVRRKVREIEENDHYSEEGKKARKKLVAEQAERRLRSALNISRLEKLHRQIEQKERSLFDLSNRLEVDLPDEEALAREQEIRDRLLERKRESEHGAIEVQEIAREAARNDDRLTLRAIEKAPDSFPVLSENAVQEIQEVHAESVFPDHVEELRTKRQAFEAMRFNTEEARDTFRDLTGRDPIDSPVFKVRHSGGEMEPIEVDALGEEGGSEDEGGGEKTADEPAGEGAEPAAV